MTTTRKPNFFIIIIPALTILVLLTAQALHFHDRPYRQDEAWVVHYGIENIQRIGFVNHLLQVFQLLPPENFLQDIWVRAFGHIENIVRYLSTLTLFITMAMFYRLASDLFDRQTGRIAVVILGTISIFMFFTHEARPYAALAFGTVGFQWMLLRFIRQPKSLYFVLALCFSVIPFYQHPFLLYVFAGQVACVLIFVRWNQGLYLRGIALFVLMGLLIVVRLYINFGERSGVITYGTSTSLEGLIALYNEFRFNPESLGLLLFGCGIFLPIERLNFRRHAEMMRFGQRWRKWWMIGALVIMLVAILGVNVLVESVTPRNLIVIAPYMALIVAYGIRHLPWQAHLLSAVMFIVPYVLPLILPMFGADVPEGAQFRSHAGNAGYPELADYMQANYDRDEGRMVIIANQSWEWIPIKYYLDERTNLGLEVESVFYVSTSPGGRFTPQIIEANQALIGSRRPPPDDQFDNLTTYLGEYEKLWVIKGNRFPAGEFVQEWIDENYTIYNRADFPGQTYYRALEVIEYRRNPDLAEPVVRFGDDIMLMDWQLNDSVVVSPCQTISLDTWWQTNTSSDIQYSSTVVIADEAGQGIVNADDMPGGVYVTPLWQPDKPYFDERFIIVPCDIDSGQYPLLLGFYDIDTVENFPVLSANGEPLGTSLLYLTTLTVE